MNSPAPPPLRRNRDFLLLWSGSAISILGSNVSSVAYPLLVLAITGSARDAGLTGFVALLPQLLFQLPAGAIVDRVNRKRLMIWCDLVCGLAVGSIMVAVVLHRLTLGHILVVGFIEGSFAVCNRLAGAAAVPNVVHPTQLASALARNETRRRAATMLGQPLGGLLFGIGRGLPFLFDALSYVVSIFSLTFIRSRFEAVRTNASPRPGFTELTEGMVWLWRQPFLRVTTLVIAGSNFLFQALFLSIIVIATEHGASASEVGLLFGIAAVGGVLGALAAPVVARRFTMRAVVIGCNWAWATLVPLLLVVRDPILIGGVYALMCFIGPLWNISVSAYQIRITPDRIRGRVLGAASMLGFGAIPLGSLLGGLSLSAFGATSTVWLLAAWMVLLAVSTLVSKAIRHAPNPSEGSATAERVVTVSADPT